LGYCFDIYNSFGPDFGQKKSAVGFPTALVNVSGVNQRLGLVAL
jgi:hypothetical protein